MDEVTASPRRLGRVELPRGFCILPAAVAISGVRTGGDGWAVFSLVSGEEALVAVEELAGLWTSTGLIDEATTTRFPFEGRTLVALQPGGGIVDLARWTARPSADDAFAFVEAFTRTRSRHPHGDLASALYLPALGTLLPVTVVDEPCRDGRVDDGRTLGHFLTGGVTVDAGSVSRVVAINPALTHEELARLLSAAGMDQPQPPPAAPLVRPKFELPGRRALAAFFREHVIDLIENPEHYATLGIRFPGGVALHGPPGSGKTFAVKRLGEHLGWPVIEIGSGTVGSPYIHETGRLIAKAFDDASKAAPALLVIDEMEAFLSERTSGGAHRVEEVAEFLRLIPRARERRVLLLGMTNRLDLIDLAVLRHGRFDHTIEVSLPDLDDVRELLSLRFSALPVAEGSDPIAYAERLQGRSMADLEFFATEAARVSARARKGRIDDIALAAALRAVARPRKT